MKQSEKPSAEIPQINDTENHATLSHKDAVASSPKDIPVAGEEDPGAALEDFVESVPPKQLVPKNPRKKVPGNH